MTTATMRAVRLHAFGPAENLTYESVPRPAPGPGQVRIAVTAAGVHLLDTALRRGIPGHHGQGHPGTLRTGRPPGRQPTRPLPYTPTRLLAYSPPSSASAPSVSRYTDHSSCGRAPRAS